MLAFVLVSGSLWIILGEFWRCARSTTRPDFFDSVLAGLEVGDVTCLAWAQTHCLLFTFNLLIKGFG